MKASTVNPNPGGTPALAVRGLSVAYGDMVAVREATFTIAPGEACAVICGSMFWLYIRYTLGGKAMEACGENALGARIAGIDTRR